MNNEIKLSLCIPTNGIVEWVKPVLDSIYEEKHPIESFEVIVTDNGNSKEFSNLMDRYVECHDNLIYKKTNAIQFDNQIEAFKLASGKFIKFINHRMRLLPGALNYLLEYVLENENDKPITYFLDKDCAGEYSSFDEFVSGLSYWSSYSGGIAMWKSDFDKMDLNQTFNPLFPHVNLLFSNKDNKRYIIDGHKLLEQVQTDERKKGRYNLFYAFAVEYPSILLNLYREGHISNNTFLRVKNDNSLFLAQLYWDYVFLKKPCSYDLSDYKQNLNIFYTSGCIYFNVIVYILKRLFNKVC